MKVGIVDDHPLFRIGLAEFLARQGGIAVVWEVGSGRQALHRMREAPVDVLLMDVALQDVSDGLAATVQLIAEHSRLKVIAISGSPDRQTAMAALEAGASYFLRKDVSPDLIVTCLRRVWSEATREAASEPGRPRSLRSPRHLAAAAPRTPKDTHGLTAREQEVIFHIRLGRTNREIAERLGVSLPTVNKHVHQVLSKLKARNRAQAATMFGTGAASRPS